MGEVLLTSPPRRGLLGSVPGRVLAVLLAALLAAALLGHRQPTDLTADEVTVIAASQSLILDRDLTLGREDRQRLAAKPLTLEAPGQDIDAGPAARFPIPLPYPLLLAPIATWAPVRGPIAINALLLILTAWIVARRLSDRLGGIAAGVVSVSVFASVLYRNVFVVQPTLLLGLLVAAAFSLAFGQEEPAEHGLTEVYEPPDSRAVGVARAFVVGAAIGLVAVHSPVYLLLALPAALAWPDRRRLEAAIGVGIGMVVVLAALGIPGGLWGGRPPDWIDQVGRSIGALDVATSFWNLLYATVGRNTGILPYFLPLVALLGLWHGGQRRSVLVVTALIGVGISVLLQPYDYYGGPAAIGNRWLVPWFVLLWYVPTRPLPRGWLAATLLIATPAMYPTWLAPGIAPTTEDGIYRHAVGTPHRWLPVETTQRSLPPASESVGQRFWVRSLSLVITTGGGNRWRLEGDRWGELQLASPEPLAAVYLQFGRQAEPQLEVRGAKLGDMVLAADGGIGFRLEELERKAQHPMWWSRERYYQYVLQLKMPMEEPRPQSLVLTAIAEDVVRQRP